MRVALFAAPLLLMAPAAYADTCNALSPQPMPARTTILQPVAPELFANTTQLGAPSGVLAQPADESQSVDRVLQRLKLEGCNVAIAAPAASATGDAAYKPKTQYDNGPWRFDMNQNGKRMTAEEFDAWMKSRGVRVAKGNAPAAVPAAAAAPAPAPQPEKKD
jgi:hypothetical protein